MGSVYFHVDVLMKAGVRFAQGFTLSQGTEQGPSTTNITCGLANFASEYNMEYFGSSFKLLLYDEVLNLLEVYVLLSIDYITFTDKIQCIQN